MMLAKREQLFAGAGFDPGEPVRIREQAQFVEGTVGRVVLVPRAGHAQAEGIGNQTGEVILGG